MCQEFHYDVFCSFDTFICLPENVDATPYIGTKTAPLMHDEIVEIASTEWLEPDRPTENLWKSSKDLGLCKCMSPMFTAGRHILLYTLYSSTNQRCGSDRSIDEMPASFSRCAL